MENNAIPRDPYPFNTFLKKLNWRHALCLFVALWLIYFAFLRLCYLFHLDMYLWAYRNGPMPLAKLFVLIDAFVAHMNTMGYAGLLLGCMAGIFASVKNKLSWITPLIVLMLMLILDFLGLLDGGFVKVIFSKPEILIPNPVAAIILNSILLLTAAMLILFLPVFNRFMHTGSFKKRDENLAQ